MTTECYSVLCHGSLKKKRGRFYLPDNIEVVLYTEFEKLLFVDEVDYLRDKGLLKCHYEDEGIKKIKIYKILDNGKILCSNIIPKLYKKRIPIPNLNINFEDKDKELGIFRNIFDRSLITNKMNTMMGDELLGITSLEQLITYFSKPANIVGLRRGLKELDKKKQSTLRKQPLDRKINPNKKNAHSKKTTLKKTPPQKKIYRIHLFCCLEGKYKIANLFSDLHVDIETFLAEKMENLVIEDKCENTTDYLKNVENDYNVVYTSHNSKDIKKEINKQTFFIHLPFNKSNFTDPDINIINDFLDKDCFKGIDIGETLDQGFILIISRLGRDNIDSNITSLCLLQENGTATEPSYYIYTVCVGEPYRESGILRKMFEYIANNIKEKTSKIYLNASRLTDFGMDLTQRLEIYTNLGFYLDPVSIITPKTVKGESSKIVYSKSKNKFIKNGKEIENSEILSCKYDIDIDGCRMISTPELILNSKNKDKKKSSIKKTTSKRSTSSKKSSKGSKKGVDLDDMEVDSKNLSDSADSDDMEVDLSDSDDMEVGPYSKSKSDPNKMEVVR